ncbi:uncharacterized protein LOC141908953 [Tubulanus polymorphus]|uniref:uncharacterized protein LOC141908953 n=1 Tax=Tubulanus polymorphus TaxID=672921 RepID=UPI003DA22D9B
MKRMFILLLISFYCLTLTESTSLSESLPIKHKSNRSATVVFTEWTWIAGNNLRNQQSNISYLGSDNYPGSRSGNAYWSDGVRHAWIFGGLGFDDSIDAKIPKVLNDLWRYDMSTNRWDLLLEERRGWNHEGIDRNLRDLPASRYNSAACGKRGDFLVLYGGRTIGDHVLGDTWLYFFSNSSWINLLDIQFAPAARSEMALWCLDDQMVIFSGVDEHFAFLNDVWVFDFSKLFWREIEVDRGTDDDSRNHRNPLPRNGAVTWVTNNRTMFMFGGNIEKNLRNQHSSVGFTSDLWSFSLTRRSWRYLNGFTRPGHVAIYGVLGHGDSDTIPGCRKLSLSWVDLNGDLWLFGGEGIDYLMPNFYRGDKELSDLWKYDVNREVWVWMGGLTKGEGRATYGNIHTPSLDNLPGPRLNAATWVRNDTFYLFGGDGHDATGEEGQLNDVWVFNCLMQDFEAITDIAFVLPFSPGILFVICFSGVACVSLLLCLAVFVKKCLDLPSPGHSPEKRYVKYAPLSMDAAVELS